MPLGTDLTLLLERPVVHATAWTLVHFLWQAAAIGVSLWIALRLIGRRAHELRYWVSCAALAGLVAVPVITFLTASTHLAGSAEAGAELWFIDKAPPVASSAGATDPVLASGPASDSTADFQSYLPYLTLLWALGVIILLLRLVGGWIYIHRMIADCSAAPDRWARRFDQLAFRAGIRRAARLRISGASVGPCVVGWIRPIIVLPLGLLSGLPSWQVEAILRHELAHIRRFDLLVNMIQSLAEVILFYHPVVWWVNSRIRVEREYCCDDFAAPFAGDVRGYAAALVALESFRHSPAVAMGATHGSLRRRVERLLTTSRRERTDRPAGAVASILLALSVAIIVAACTDTLLESTVSASEGRENAVERLEKTLAEKRQQYVELKDSIDVVVASHGIRDGREALLIAERLRSAEAEYVEALGAAADRTSSARKIGTDADVELARKLALWYRRTLAQARSLSTPASPMRSEIRRIEAIIETAQAYIDANSVLGSVPDGSRRDRTSYDVVYVSKGSVSVTSGGSRLTEGTDYVVDYQGGTVTITNPAYVTAGRDIQIDYEQN